MKNFSLIILAALGILLIIGYEELGLDIGIGVKNQIVVGTVFLITAIALTFYLKAPKKNLNTKGPVLKKSKLEKSIENDPVLAKLDEEMAEISKDFIPRIRKIRDENPERFKKIQDMGIIDKDFD